MGGVADPQASQNLAGVGTCLSQVGHGRPGGNVLLEASARARSDEPSDLPRSVSERATISTMSYSGVTGCRTEAASRGVGGGGVGAGTVTAEASTAAAGRVAPHSPQNLSVGTKGLPHSRQQGGPCGGGWDRGGAAVARSAVRDGATAPVTLVPRAAGGMSAGTAAVLVAGGPG